MAKKNDETVAAEKPAKVAKKKAKAGGSLGPSDEVVAALAKVADLVGELTGRLDAIETRLDVAETAQPLADVPFVKTEALTGLKAAAAAALPQSMVGQPLSNDIMDKYAQINAKREAANAVNPRIPRSKSSESSNLKQKLREMEGQPSASVRMRLQDMKIRGALADFKILAPGSVMPRDFNDKRALITVDQFGLVISADLG